MIDTPLLTSTLAAWEIATTPEQIERFAAYLALLAEWNQRMNLVAASTLADSTRRHLLDSLALAPAWSAATPPATLADVGSGAGLPGIPLAILWPQTQVTLIESIGKKATFLAHVATELQLANVRVLSERVETLGHGPLRETCALVTARAVAQLATLAEYCLPLCHINGVWLAPKGAAVDAELAAAEAAIARLGGRTAGVYDVLVPDEPLRALVVVEKIKPTPPGYPRAVGVPARQPL